MEATKVRLEAVAYLPGTDGSNPFPSSGESHKPDHRQFGRLGHGASGAGPIPQLTCNLLFGGWDGLR